MLERLEQKEVRTHRTRIRELKTKKDKVEYILDHFQEARNNENVLCYLYWRLAEDARKMDDMVALTKTGSILRMKQQIMSEKKEKRGRKQ